MTELGKLFRDRDGDFWKELDAITLVHASGGVRWRRSTVEAEYGPLVAVTAEQMRSMASRSELSLECAADGGKCWCGEHAVG